jgi:hypothetical protein
MFAFFHLLETGAVVALVGFFILILTGGFPATRSITPVKYSVIDPQGLHAEAQAIDMQIQLADVEYPQVTSTAVVGATVLSPTALTKAFVATLGTHSTSSASTPVAAAVTAAVTAIDSTSTATSTPLSVDQALQQLSH